MPRKITLIGAGNMGGAILTGLLNSQNFSSQSITISVHTESHAKNLEENLGVTTYTDNCQAVTEADLVILAVKPYQLDEVITEIKPHLKANCLLVSIATGYSLQQAEKDLGSQIKFARVMPNLPAQIGQGVSALAPNHNISADDLEFIQSVFATIGLVEIIAETQLDAITGLSGSSPALIFMMIEAMADAGVNKGLSRDQALKLASQAVAGSAAMISQENLHPEVLKDRVCTPAGTTIDLVRQAEKDNFRSTVQEAIIAAIDKSSSLS
ncbi:pyrroline-5-carboxylate reductase [Aerococcus kribbianus]|uniref:Pyrroline-5-carboxylate reductase n=1 Tax=Aerococcus kribbianus TaxID=2999064 RepID=A0A9X3FQR5_9LACT|nr:MULTISPECIES: pyrroline-5-carboxylate reductase [unclassified Aerococcus]MCZ0718125.1 pyrroline-5-carboxylate reductase [Aerococcus sp. YH-aer221]MCZ0726306.1 pyrroline-5-carboxylate reductase [Aerococcus sp. YH-aer222]